MQSKSLVELVRSGELRPPEEISTCHCALMDAYLKGRRAGIAEWQGADK
jgi:hypothetical protein